MKRTFTIFTILFLALASALEAKASKLILRTITSRATVIIDGQAQVSSNGEFRFQNLRPGNHRVIIKEFTHRNGHYHRGNHRGKRIIFDGRIRIPRQSVVRARVTPRGRLIVDQVRPLNNRNRRYDGYNRNQRSRDYQDRDYRNRDDWRYDDSRDYNRGNRGSQFNEALRSVRFARFESDRVMIAKSYIRINRVSSNQILRLMDEMNFESSRLEIAKFGYRFTRDKENYFVVHRGFKFSSSSRELDRFLR